MINIQLFLVLHSFFLTAATAQPFSAFYLSIFFLLSFFRWSLIHLFFCTYLFTYSIIFVLLYYFLALLFSALPYIQFSYFLSFILSIAAFHSFFYFFFLPFFVILLYFTSLFHSFSLRKVFPGKWTLLKNCSVIYIAGGRTEKTVSKDVIARAWVWHKQLRCSRTFSGKNSANPKSFTTVCLGSCLLFYFYNFHIKNKNCIGGYDSVAGPRFSVPKVEKPKIDF